MSRDHRVIYLYNDKLEASIPLERRSALHYFESFASALAVVKVVRQKREGWYRVNEDAKLAAKTT